MCFSPLIRFLPLATAVLLPTTALAQGDFAPLPIDPLWKSDSFRRAVTGSFGIDSRIEPVITTDEEFYLEKAAEAMAAGSREDAIRSLRESSLLPESPAMLFSLGTFLFEEGEADEALEIFREALERFPNFRDAHRNLAIVLVQKEDYETARKHLVRAVELGSREGLTMGLLGYCHSVNGHHRAALDAYRLAALTQPGERQWRVGEAQSLQGLGRPGDALAIFHQLIDESPADLNLWLTRADAYIGLGESLSAVSDLELVYRAARLSPDATLSLGHLYLQIQLPGPALERYRSATEGEEKVTLAKAAEALGFLSENALWSEARTLHDHLSAEASYRAALDDPETPASVRSTFHRTHALLELAEGRIEEGKSLVSRWLEEEPTDGRALLLLASAHEQAGEREEAEMRLEQAASLPDHAAEAHLQRGRLLVNVGEYEGAIYHLKQAQELDPKESTSEYLEAVRELVR